MKEKSAILIKNSGQTMLFSIFARQLRFPLKLTIYFFASALITSNSSTSNFSTLFGLMS